MDEKLRILVIGGHPADVFDHCGGTMAHHIKDGDRVTCLALTQGLSIHDTVVSEVFRFGVSLAKETAPSAPKFTEKCLLLWAETQIKPLNTSE